jgi:di/tricarboxylate transporter
VKINPYFQVRNKAMYNLNRNQFPGELVINLDILIVTFILGGSIILFVSERLPVDIVALLVLVSLALTGLVTPSEALSGFSNSAVVTVWAVLVLSGALSQTGIATLIGNRLMQFAGQSEVRLLVVIMFIVGILSGFMNSIGVASLFLPVVIDIARQTKRPPSKLLMPLSFAALLGGLVTLIGTPPNILISEALQQAGLKPFTMFDFTPIGLIILAAGIVYMAFLGKRLLPDRNIAQSVMDESSRSDQDTASNGKQNLHGLHEHMFIVRIPTDSPLAGRTLVQSRFGAALGINVIAILRNRNVLLAPDTNTVLKEGDRILVGGRIDELKNIENLNFSDIDAQQITIDDIISNEIKIAEIELMEGNQIGGKTLLQSEFRSQFAVNVLAIRRGETLWRTNLRSITLNTGDVLLVQGKKFQIEQLKQNNGFLVKEPDNLEEYKLYERLIIVQIENQSVLAGKTIVESRLSDAYGLGVLGIIRDGETHLMPDPQERLSTGDILIVRGEEENLKTVQALQNLELDSRESIDVGDLESEEVGLVEAVLSPYTTQVGKTLQELHFRAKYGLNVLSIWREGHPYSTNLRDMRLQMGDALLLYGPREKLRMLGSEPDFLVLTRDAQEPQRLHKAPLALLIMAGVLASVILGWVNIAIAVVTGVILMVVTGCITMEEAYRSIQLKAIFLIAGMLPLGIALERTGAANLIAESMVDLLGPIGPSAIMGGLFLLSTFASQVMPNPAVVVLLAPIALNAANSLDVSPYPLMMAVAISASAALLSPVGHPANVLVMGPGGYRFGDYTKVGLPLSLVIFLIVMLVMPYFWPF